MACNLKDATCPYDRQCLDCLHHITGATKKQYSKTGIDTSNMVAYSREYKRVAREKQLQLEMKCAGVA